MAASAGSHSAPTAGTRNIGRRNFMQLFYRPDAGRRTQARFGSPSTTACTTRRKFPTDRSARRCREDAGADRRLPADAARAAHLRGHAWHARLPLLSRASDPDLSRSASSTSTGASLHAEIPCGEGGASGARRLNKWFAIMSPPPREQLRARALVGVAQLALEHLADRAARQASRLHGVQPLQLAEARVRPCAQRFGVDRYAGRHDEGDRRLAPGCGRARRRRRPPPRRDARAAPPRCRSDRR